MLTLDSFPGQPVRLNPEISFLRLLRILIILIGLLMPLLTFSQNVGINGTGAPPNPSAMLDIASTNSGILIPRMSSAQRLAIGSPATGLLVYDNSYNQFFFFDGLIWERLLGTYTGWNVSGNIVAPGAFIGTINNSPFPVYTNNLERMRVTNNGYICMNMTTPSLAVPAMLSVQAFNGDAGLFVQGASTPFMPMGYFINTGPGTGLVSYVSASAQSGIIGFGNTGSSGVYGVGNGILLPVIGAGCPLGAGGAFISTQYAVYGSTTGNVNAIGAYFAGNSTPGILPASGCGLAATGTLLGLVGFAKNAADGNGIVASGNNTAGLYLLSGSGGSFTGITTGIASYSLSSGIAESVYTEQFGNVVRVNYWNGFTQFKIAGAGTMPVSCTIKDSSGTDRTMYCAESPDFHFTDYGSGQLQNGRTHIEIDPLLAGKILVDENHPLRVFVQLEGDTLCEGVVVANKSGNGFDVIELRNGHSNASFQWQIVCFVKDEVQENGRVNHLSDIRFQQMGEKRIAEQMKSSLPEIPAEEPGSKK